MKILSNSNDSTREEKNISHETLGTRTKDHTDWLKELEKNNMNNIGAELNFKEGPNRFFADVFKRFEGVFGNYNKRGRRVKRTSV